MATADEIKEWIDTFWPDKMDKTQGTTAQRPTTCGKPTMYFDTDRQSVDFWVDDKWVDISDNTDFKLWIANRVGDNTDDSTGNVYRLGYTNGKPHFTEVDPTWSNPSDENEGDYGGFAPVYKEQASDSRFTDSIRRMTPMDIHDMISSANTNDWDTYSASLNVDDNAVRQYSNSNITNLVYRNATDMANTNALAKGNHTHDYSGTAFNKNFGTGSTDVATGNHSHPEANEYQWVRIYDESWSHQSEHRIFDGFEMDDLGYEYKIVLREEEGNPTEIKGLKFNMHSGENPNDTDYCESHVYSRSTECSYNMYQQDVPTSSWTMVEDYGDQYVDITGDYMQREFGDWLDMVSAMTIIHIRPLFTENTQFVSFDTKRGGRVDYDIDYRTVMSRSYGAIPNAYSSTVKGSWTYFKPGMLGLKFIGHFLLRSIAVYKRKRF